MVCYKRCLESCFLYDPNGRGCSYNSGDFEATEKVEPGQKCIHPNFSHDELIEVNISDLCGILEPPN